MRRATTATVVFVLACAMLAGSCSSRAGAGSGGFRLESAPGPADAAVATLGVTADYVVTVTLDAGGAGKETTLPKLYGGDGWGFVTFAPSGRYVAVHGEPGPGVWPTKVAVVDLTSGEPVVLASPEKCGVLGQVVFSADSARLAEVQCGAVQLRRAAEDAWPAVGSGFSLDAGEVVWALSADQRLLTRHDNEVRVRDASTGRVLTATRWPGGFRAADVDGASGVFGPGGEPVVVTPGQVWSPTRGTTTLRYTSRSCIAQCATAIAGRSDNGIAWTVQTTEKPAEMEVWALGADATTPVRQGTATGGADDDYLSLFVSDRLLRKGSDRVECAFLER